MFNVEVGGAVKGRDLTVDSSPVHEMGENVY